MKRVPLLLLVAMALNACSSSSGGGGSTPSGSGSGLQITTTGLPDGQVNVSYTQSLSATGGVSPYHWAITSGALPSGLSLSPSGSISGTPTVAGTSSFVVTAADSATPAASVSAALSVTILAAGTTASPLRVTTTSLSGATVGVSYSAQLTASGGTTPISWTLGAGSSLPPGLTLSSAGALAGTPTIAGSYGFTVVVVDSSSPQQSASAALSLTVTSTAGSLVVSTANLPQGTVGTAYGQQLNATGGTAPYSWLVAAGTLPYGLTLSTSGLLSGTPTTSGSFDFTVQVDDGSATPQVAQATFLVTVNPNPSQAVSITTGSLATGIVDHAYQDQLQAAGGVAPYSWSVIAGALPGGLTLSASGSITGTPTAAGAFSFTVEAADASSPTQTATRQFTITVAASQGQTFSIATQTLPNGVVGTAYTATLTASGGTPPYSWSVTAGSLPAGLNLSGDGIVSGTPTASGTSTFTVTVVDSATTPLTASRQFSITIR